MGIFDFLKNKKNSVVKNNESVESIFSNNECQSGIYEVEFFVEDVFNVFGKGTVVTGIVEKGMIHIGEELTILSSNKKTSIVGVEQFRKKLDYAQVGDKVGLLLNDISREEVKQGDILFK